MVLSFGANVTQGQDTAVPKIPVTLQPAVRDSLATDRTQLLASVDAHNRNVRDWKGSCGQVASDNPSYAACHQEFQRLSAEAAAVIASKKQFAKRLDSSVAAAAACAGDPNVVNGCDVPSGLPPELDRAILDHYSSAPAGVSDRVRKAFQAVESRDWGVAKAWFDDALMRDPDNAGLKRLSALSASATTTVTQLPPRAGNEIYRLFPTLEPMDDAAALNFLFGLK